MKFQPKCRKLTQGSRYKKKAVRSVRLDESDLIIEIQGTGFSYAKITFHNVIGFRVIDEREITEFWNTYSEPNGWLWEVLEGGWLSLENQRETFNVLDLPLREFFIADEFCINVWCENEPVVEDLGSDPDD